MKNNLYIVWSDTNEIGIPIIDEQHRGIISTINSLYYFIQSGHGPEIIKPTMIMLEQYTAVHFETEEALLAEVRYLALEEHILLHKGLVRKTKKLSINANRDKDSDMVLKFLKEWWLGHINTEDRKYVSFLRKLMNTKDF